MTRTNHIDHIQVILSDQSVEMDVDEIQPCRRAPMTQETRLDIMARQGSLEQGVSRR